MLLFVHMLILRPENLVWGNPVFERLHLVAFLLAIVGYLVRMKSMEARFDNPWTKRGLWIFGAFVAWALVVSALATDSVEMSFNQSFNQTVEIAKIWLLCWLLSRIVVDRREIGPLCQ